MNISSLQADQLGTWSDNHASQLAQAALIRFAPTPPTAVTAAAAARASAPRLAHRALQTLRQTGMQVCRRSRPWSQVLPLGKLPRLATANGLRSASASCPGSRMSRQLPPGPDHRGGDLRDQPRTAAPPRGAIASGDESTFFLLRFARHAIGCCAPGQYAGRLARERSRFGDSCGDRR
jgi:hypothetical protein